MKRKTLKKLLIITGLLIMILAMTAVTAVADDGDAYHQKDIGELGYKLVFVPESIGYYSKAIAQQNFNAVSWKLLDPDGKQITSGDMSYLENIGENKNWLNAGKMTFRYTIKKTGYKGSVTADFEIKKAELTKDIVVAAETVNELPFTGKPIEPKYSVYNKYASHEKFVEGETYFVEYQNNVAIGTAKAIVTFRNYEGSVEKTFKIMPIKMKNIQANGFYGDYDGKPHSFVLTGVPKGATVTYSLDGKNYTSEKPYFTEINNGAIVYYKVEKPYYETYSHWVKVSINPIDISDMQLMGLKEKYNYNGGAVEPDVYLPGLVKGKDYTVTYYSNNFVTKFARVQVKGIGKYRGIITEQFTIVESGGANAGSSKAAQTITVGGSTSKAKFTKTHGNAAFNLNAKAKTKLTYKSSNAKVVTVSSTGKVTIKGPGRATVTIKAAASNKYKAAIKTVTIDVKPKKVGSVTLKAAKEQMTASWTKVAQASGYQVVYSTDKNFKKNIKTTNVTSLKKTVSGLKSGTTYYVKVRAYKTAGSAKIFGAYSGVKKIKVK